MPALPTDNDNRLFKVTAPDVSARDNTMLAEAATSIAAAMQTLESLLQSGTTPEFKRLVTDIILKFAGERPKEGNLKTLINQPAQNPPSPPGRGTGGEG